MPKKSSHRIPSYRRHKTGQAFIQIKGKRTYLGKHGTPQSKQLYAEVLNEFLKTGESPNREKSSTKIQSSAAITIVELIAKYWSHCEKYYRKNGKPTSELDIIKRTLRGLKSTYGYLPAKELGPLKLKALRETYIKEKLARTTINKYVGRIVSMFRWAAEHELVPVTSYQALKSVRGLLPDRTAAIEPEPIKPVRDEIVERTIAALPQVVGDMVAFQRLTGCRPGEVCGIRPIDVSRQDEIWEFRPESHKTEHLGKQRIIFIGPKAQTVLQAYLLRPEDEFCFSPNQSEAKRQRARNDERKTPVGQGNSPGSNRESKPKKTPGSFYTIASYRRAIERACKKAGVEKWCPNQLRHSAGTEIRREFGIEAASVLLGHASTNTTEIYAEKNRQLAANIARKLG